jgi:hypothetical protein
MKTTKRDKLAYTGRDTGQLNVVNRQITAIAIKGTSQPANRLERRMLAKVESRKRKVKNR